MSHKNRAFKFDLPGSAPLLRLAASDGLPVDHLSEQLLAQTESAAALEIVAFLKGVGERLPSDSSLRVDLVTLGARLERFQSRL